jgi:secreted PhoX family phosphatase
MGILAAGPLFGGCTPGGGSNDRPEADASAASPAGGNVAASGIEQMSPLGAPDANGLRLADGFTSRIVARSSQRPVGASGYLWHAAPDGGATYATSDGGWIYVSNSEISRVGGVGALRFAPDGTLVDAYPILANTNRNCAGGPTPWQTWLSCEEVDRGRVFECDPFGRDPAVHRPALGAFKHEAAAVDPVAQVVYLTEDETDGRLYRYLPDGTLGNGRPDLDRGALEVAEVTGGQTGSVVWHRVPDPSAAALATRHQVPASTPFRGGEGIDHFDDVIYFATKGDDRVWAYDIARSELELVYDRSGFSSPQLTGVDNVVVSPAGDVLVAEDGGDLEIVALTPSGAVVPVVQIVGHDRSEVTGPAFDPSGTRLYFSSQRGTTGRSSDGVTFEVSGPFLA